MSAIEEKTATQQSESKWMKLIATKAPAEIENNKSINTLCIVFSSNKNNTNFYYGYNRTNLEFSTLNEKLKTVLGFNVQEAKENWPASNCAEIEAVNNALNDGLSVTELCVTACYIGGQYAWKEACDNCKLWLAPMIVNNVARKEMGIEDWKFFRNGGYDLYTIKHANDVDSGWKVKNSSIKNEYSKKVRIKKSNVKNTKI